MKLFEGFLHKRKFNTKTDTIHNSNTDNRLPDPSGIMKVSNYNVWQIISKLRDLNDIYRYRYAEYDMMAEDVIIQSALELYADDATQLDSNTQKIVSVIVDGDHVLQEDLNSLLESLNIDSRIWQWAYDLSKYGDVYLKPVTEDDEGNPIPFRIEDIEDPSEIMDLWYKGERVAYAWEDIREDEKNSIGARRVNGRINIADKDQYIHLMIKKSSKTDKLEIDIPGEFDKITGEPKYKEFSVVRGTSMIEGVRPIFRIIQLLEDSLLAAKIAMTEFIRVYNIEVGDDTPKKTTETINRVKNLFDQKASFDVSTGRYKANKEYRPIGDPVFNPVRNGKGSISHEDIGGNFEVKDITDMEYFNNKLFAGLKIPKAYLGFEESLPGGLGDNTLTRLDIRYSRSVKRVQKPLCQGVKDILVLWCKINSRTINESKIKVIIEAPSSSEELSRLAELDMRMNTIDRIASTISSNLGETINMPKIFKILFSRYINYPELKDDLIAEFDDAIKKKEELDKAKEEEERQVPELNARIEELEEELRLAQSSNQENKNEFSDDDQNDNEDDDDVE